MTADDVPRAASDAPADNLAEPPSTPVQHAPSPAATMPLTAGQKNAAETAEDMDIEGGVKQQAQRDAALIVVPTAAAANTVGETAPAAVEVGHIFECWHCPC